MAVTNCPECGGKVSDQAMSCPHCGVSLSHCPKCGGVIKWGVSACPHCGIGLEWNNSNQKESFGLSSLSGSDDKSEKKDDGKLGCWGWIGIIFALAIIGSITDKCGGSDDSTATDDADTTKVEQVIQSSTTEEKEEETTTDNETDDDYVQIQLESIMSGVLKKHYRDFSKLIKLEKLPSTSDYNYKFTIEEKIGGGMTCKQQGFIKCYADGEVSDVISYGDPFDFRDNKGNDVHDRTGYGLY